MKYILISDPDISFKKLKDEHFAFIYFRENQWEIRLLNGDRDFFEYDDIFVEGEVNVGLWVVVPNSKLFKMMYPKHIVKNDLIYAYKGEVVFTGEDLKRRLI